MRVAFVAGADPSSSTAWSGVMQPLRAALGNRMEVVDVVVPPQRDALVDRAAARVLGAAGMRSLPGFGSATALRAGRALTRVVAEAGADAVLAVVASQYVSNARIRVPVVSVSDATLPLLFDFYEDYSGLPWWVRRQAEAVERRAWRRSTQRVVSSEWARRSLVEDYGLPPDTCHTVPFGPAITAEPQPSGSAPRTDGGSPVRMLTVARDWRRKRGDLVVAVAERAAVEGLPVTLSVVGSRPAGVADSPTVRFLGLLDREAMGQEYARHDVLVDLADANCSAVTVTDAVAAGLPVVASDVGAAAELVLDGRTGVLVPPDASVAEIVGVLRDLIPVERRAALGSGARRHAAASLSWDVWAARVSGILASAVQGTGG